MAISATNMLLTSAQQNYSLDIAKEAWN